jgi:NAD(P)-dependent dehydrogenase (short-subunit alcohol dehydrogenase family)
VLTSSLRAVVRKELDEAVKAIGSNVTGVQGDVAKLADLDRLYETVKAEGRIDIVLANAGIAEFTPLGSITEEHFDKLFNINVKHYSRCKKPYRY